MAGNKLKTARTSDAVTKAEAKLHLKVSVTDDDDLIDDLIDTAQEAVEAFTNRKLSTETWYLYLDEFPSGNIVLPFSPISAITSVKYYDSDNAQQTYVADTDYYININAEPATIIEINGWDATKDKPDAIVVEYVMGYSSPATVPKKLKQAMLSLIGDMYENREDAVRERFTTWKALAYPERVFHSTIENEP